MQNADGQEIPINSMVECEPRTDHELFIAQDMCAHCNTGVLLQ